MTKTTARRRWPLAAALGTLVALCPTAAYAQIVLGRVLERGGGGPVPGAMVRLYAQGALTGSGWLTASDGRFRLQPPAGGTYEIHVERIGFAPTVVDGVQVVAGGIASIDVVVEPRPIALEGLEVSAGGGRCQPGVRDGGAAQVIWDEARKALSAASWTESQGGLRFLVTVWDRRLAARTSQILAEETSQRETFGSNSVQSLEPERLVAEGYVRSDRQFTYYYAPDAEALLSDAFQDTHCFRIVETEDGSPWVGLGFEPNAERDLPDVEGVIWLDRVSARLDRVEFRYTGIEVPGANLARGQVRFAELENGRWIVRDWLIQAPMPSAVRVPSGFSSGVGLEIHEVGNSVDLVEGEGVSWVAGIAPGVVRGTVFDSIADRPLAGAGVRIGGRNVRAQADLDGRFELRGIGPGLHRITFEHPRLDSLGVSTGWRSFEMDPAGLVELELAVPPWISLLAGSCTEDGAGALVGFVYAPSGAKAAGATVEVLRPDSALDAPLRATSDTQGGWVICDAPVGVARLVARLGTSESEVVEVRADSTRFVVADLTVRRRPMAEVATVPGAMRPAIVGTVLERSSRRPLEGVAVALLDPSGESIASTITDAEGRFSAVLDEGAEVFLRVSRFGYTGAVSESIALIEGTRRIEVLLPEEAIEIDPVIVVVDSRLPYLEQVGFYQRAVAHPGAFIQQDDVDAVAPARTSDLLGRVPGVRVTTETSGGHIRRRVLFNRLALLEGDLCYPAVFVDDQLVRIGGSRTESQWPAVQGVEPPQGDDVPSIDELVPPHEIVAVEMYENAARLPGRFIGLGTHCGVIVFWTTRAR